MRHDFMLIGVVALSSAWGGPALADPRADCDAAGGTLISGTVTSAPVFVSGHFRHGVELSHTHVVLQSARDGSSYDVAIDNVFASGYDDAGEDVPSPLDRIQDGAGLEVCGKPYSDGTGIDRVHTNCGDNPTSNNPNGWVRIIDGQGNRSDNLESSTEYCRLFVPGGD